MIRALGSMRKLFTPSTATSSSLSGRILVINPHRQPFQRQPAFTQPTLRFSRSLAQVRQEPFSELWFTASRPARTPLDDLLGNSPVHGGNEGYKRPDERTLKLGKTLRTLSPLLPNILTQPLPPDILSPSISLHLFPSTHPHLPAVKGRVPYRAGLWSAPVAWGCVPLVGNVKLQILSEKIVRSGFVSIPQPENGSGSGFGEEKLVVRWKTEKKVSGSSSNTRSTVDAASGNGDSATGINRGLSALLGGDKPIFNLSKGDEFSGMFIFTFDSEGRIATHTIEHADESNCSDKTSRVVTLTDWLLGRAKWRSRTEDEMIPGLAMNPRVCREEWTRGRIDESKRHGQLHGRW